MIILGSEELCEFQYQDNLDGRNYCNDWGLYSQLEHEIGNFFFRGRFSRNSNHRLIGKFGIYSGKLSKIRLVVNSSGLLGCDMNSPCYEVQFNSRIEGEKEDRDIYLPINSNLIEKIFEELEINYLDEIKELNLSCFVGVIPSNSGFGKITLNPRKETTDEIIRRNHLLQIEENYRIFGISRSRSLDKILNSIKRNSSD